MAREDGRLRERDARVERERDKGVPEIVESDRLDAPPLSPAASPARWTERSAFRRDCGFPRAATFPPYRDPAEIPLSLTYMTPA